ncbi:uncharacterized protein LOC115626735 [Scaptodrosophila lebanonensis]|uniref:Uncharacterized protein LOC115626735 n=1 Tax=Drosophila lebanonensis TaxID=7225 RepID=A0A6J2TSD5_DROLE|nr:uncharacterized protein LOC115626735 [Scaptodrosophila lebanonensis]XP_030378043.1 uncharacterized protein LOC115626735 [Scaptodrosophila lebanonensis]XP_030378044.1 uncharacterized protein LOC115626735 [Scaptodrosophila lebanonensis]
MLKIPRPSRSMLQCGLAALATVLLMSWVRPLGVLFLGLFSYWLYWTRCSFRIVLTPELRHKYENWLHRASDWKRNSPTMFCLVSSGCLGTLAILGHLISGSTLVLTLLVLSALISTKYNFKLLKIEHKDFQWSEKLNYNSTEAELEDEFMPDATESNLFVLERASNVATISSPTDADDEEERSDEIPSELLIPDRIPEIDEHSTDEDDELIPTARKQTQLTSGQQSALEYEKQPSPEAAKAAANPNPIEFRKGHFKRDSSLSTTSSSSEESLSKGLQFPDHTSVDASAPALRQLNAGEATHQAAIPSTSSSGEVSDLLALAVKSQTQALLANSSKILPSLISGLAQWGPGGAAGPGSVDTTDAALKHRVVTALDSSDESDFEILESDDFK